MTHKLVKRTEWKNSDRIRQACSLLLSLSRKMCLLSPQGTDAHVDLLQEEVALWLTRNNPSLRYERQIRRRERLLEQGLCTRCGGLRDGKTQMCQACKDKTKTANFNRAMLAMGVIRNET